MGCSEPLESSSRALDIEMMVSCCIYVGALGVVRVMTIDQGYLGLTRVL